MARKKKRTPKTDGLGPREKAKIRAAVRQVWHRSEARRLATFRSTDKDGYRICEAADHKGKRRVPHATIDHIIPCGEVDGGFIERMFVSSGHLMALCKKCHQAKTNKERAQKRQREKEFDGYDLGF